MEFNVGDKVILVCNTFVFPREEEATIKSVERNCYVVQREFGTMTVNLDRTIPAWGGGSYMKKFVEQNESPGC